MERFVPKFQGRAWTDGLRVLHVYALPRGAVNHALLELAHEVRSHMQGYPIDPLYPDGPADPGVLHLTLEMIADTPAADITQGQRTKLVDALRKEVAPLAPITTLAGPPIANVAGIVLDIHPDDQVRGLQDRVRGAVRATRGDAALQHAGGRPHIQLGYSYSDAASDPLNGVLRNQVFARRAPLLIDRVHLLDVRYEIAPDTGGWRMTWDSIAEIRLDG